VQTGHAHRLPEGNSACLKSYPLWNVTGQGGRVIDRHMILLAILRWWDQLAICLVIGAALSVAAGQDANWDLRNYHLYSAYSILTGQFDRDIFSADFQSAYNPTLDFPYVLLAMGPLAHWDAAIYNNVFYIGKGIDIHLFLWSGWGAQLTTSPSPTIFSMRRVSEETVRACGAKRSMTVHISPVRAPADLPESHSQALSSSVIFRMSPPSGGRSHLTLCSLNRAAANRDSRRWRATSCRKDRGALARVFPSWTTAGVIFGVTGYRRAASLQSARTKSRAINHSGVT
jgi:hypothetical protein